MSLETPCHAGAFPPPKRRFLAFQHKDINHSGYGLLKINKQKDKYRRGFEKDRPGQDHLLSLHRYFVKPISAEIYPPVYPPTHSVPSRRARSRRWGWGTRTGRLRRQCRTGVCVQLGSFPFSFLHPPHHIGDKGERDCWIIGCRP